MERKPPRRTRERILSLALRLFNDLGEPNVTTSAISDEMNISPGNLYYHFRNKDDIINALFEQFEREIDELLDTPARADIGFEDAWLFLHLLFESIWRYRFLYRDLNDLLSRNRRLETHFKTILERKTRAAHRLCSALAEARQLQAGPREVEALATNMVVVATWWLSYEYVGNARRFNDPDYQNAAMARGAYQVLVLLAPYLSEDGRALFNRLANEYLRA
ncbi:TetR/AcrR family transcriptional regulator [Quisquiliibacterium transsilvanicum]|uniref:AcrR family transcriptional regulator n=1 Tax=Quisquiliibacterium transsilvanicum TaxID=1549638 RepID=A0A7W8HFE6_9BURK|nr:TetR/AcrR family transcriptional regulator [Quisquiliibacterium transsilvanicum]MBB5271006.1 AcrR family transcriptional regulator [Quisquiliibacterium transsilvanicum]